MTYSPSIKTKQNRNITGSTFQITNDLNVSGNSIFGNATTDTITVAGVLAIYEPLTASANITCSYNSTTVSTLDVNGNTTTNILTASTLRTTIGSGYVTQISVGLTTADNIAIQNLFLTSSNTVTDDNITKNLFSYPTNFESQYLVESNIIARSPNNLRITGSTTVANSNFGTAIISKDNEVFIGAPLAPDTSQRRGRVYVYSTDSNGNVKKEVLVLSSSGNPSVQYFGRSLLLYNNQIIVGAPSDKTDASSTTGSVYIFESGTNGWAQKQKLTASDGVAKNEFGLSLHASGNYLFIGSPGNTISSGVTGSVYIFTTGTSGWNEVQKISSSYGTTSSYFAKAITTVGEDLLIAISAIGTNYGTGNLALFQSGANGWQEKQKISAGENIYGSQTLLTLSDKKTAIMTDTINTTANTGKAFIFVSQSSGYSMIQSLTASDQQINARFGASIQASGTTLYIANESFGSTRHGIYVFNSGSTGWIQTTKLTASTDTVIKDSLPTARDGYGTSICLHKNTIYDGGPNDDQNQTDMGAVIYFLSQSNGWEQQGAPLSFASSIKGVYKNIGGTLYLTGTSTQYSSSDFTGKTVLYERYIDNSPLNLTSVLAPGIQSYTMSSLYDDSTKKYYLAVCFPRSGGGDGGSSGGKIRIFSSSNNSTWSSALADYSGTSAINTYLGTDVQLVSSSYGLYCFVSALSASGNESGSLYYLTSSNGTNWSGLNLAAMGTAGSRFGTSLSALYEKDSKKFIVIIGAYAEVSNVGYIYAITSSNGVDWSTKTRIMSGNGPSDYAGEGTAIIAVSGGYQAYGAARSEDLPVSAIGDIYLVTSSDAVNWSNQIVIASGSYQYPSGDATGITYVGHGGIRAINYNNRSYVFFAEPYYDTGSNFGSNEGAIFVASSSNDNFWGTSNTYSDKTMLLSGSNVSDYVTTDDLTQKPIDVKIFNNKIYYSFGAPGANTQFSNAGKVYFGTSSDGINWQKYTAQQQDMLVYTGSSVNSNLGQSVSILATDNNLNLYAGESNEVFYTNVSYYTQSMEPLNVSCSYNISGTNMLINVTGGINTNISWNHLTKIYEV